MSQLVLLTLLDSNAYDERNRTCSTQRHTTEKRYEMFCCQAGSCPPLVLRSGPSAKSPHFRCPNVVTKLNSRVLTSQIVSATYNIDNRDQSYLTRDTIGLYFPEFGFQSTFWSFSNVSWGPIGLLSHFIRIVTMTKCEIHWISLSFVWKIVSVLDTASFSDYFLKFIFYARDPRILISRSLRRIRNRNDVEKERTLLSICV